MPIYTFDAGTDVATVGVWDRKWSAEDFLKKTGKGIGGGLQWQEALARDGGAFYISTGADGSYPMALYVNQPVPAELLAKYRSYNQGYGLHVESGTVIVGGMEDCGRAKRAITSDKDEVQLAPGWYQVRLHENCAAEVDDPGKDERLAGLTPRERRVYTWYNRLMPCGCLPMVVGAILLLSKKYLWGLGVAGGGILWMVAVGVIFSKLLGHDEITKKVRGVELANPAFILELQSVPGPLPGGWIHTAG